MVLLRAFIYFTSAVAYKVEESPSFGALVLSYIMDHFEDLQDAAFFQSAYMILRISRIAEVMSPTINID